LILNGRTEILNPPVDPKSDFTKSERNRRVEREGLVLLLQDPRIQAVDLATKRAIVQRLPVGDFGIQTFDAVMTSAPISPITFENIDEHVESITLLEMKTTKKPIKSGALNGFFFGATEREYEMARVLGDRYKWAFVVLNDENDYGRPFFVLLSLEDVERRTRAKRVQFQVNFRTDTIETNDIILFGEPAD
jgi:hypothetical protein